MRVFIGVEYVVDGEFADGENQSIRGLRSAKLIWPGFYFLAVAAEIDGLSDESTRDAGIGHRLAPLQRFLARKSGDARRSVEPKTLIDLGIDPQLGGLPQPHAHIGGRVKGFAPLVGNEA